MNFSREINAQNGSSPRWGEEDTQKLLRLYVQGLSASKIAFQLGTTRNAILGRLWRLRRRDA